MSFILEFSIEANVGYTIREGIGLGIPNMVKVLKHYQVEDLTVLRSILGKTYGDYKIVDDRQYTDRRYERMLTDCQNEATSAAQSNVKRFNIAKADENISIEIKYYEEAVQ